MAVESFGGKIAWLAVPASDTATVVRALKLTNATEMEDFYSGLQTAEREWDHVLLTPPIDGWVLIIGWWTAGWRNQNEHFDLVNQRLLDTVKEISLTMGECQTFGCHRVNGYANWTWAKQGNLLRAFHYAANTGLLANIGDHTSVEEEFDWASLGTGWFPEAEEVCLVAESWSVDPSLLSERTDINDNATLAQVTETKRTESKRPWWRIL
jgi:hypothetical protein